LQAKTKKEKYDRIKEKKVSTTVEALCRGSPEEFQIYLNYCRSLKFEEKPDYNYCRKVFKDLMYRMGYENDLEFDWILKKSGKKIQNDGDFEKKLNNAAIAAKQ